MNKLPPEQLWTLPPDQLRRRLRVTPASQRALEAIQRRRDALVLKGREPFPLSNPLDVTTGAANNFDFGGDKCS
jgi:hypothetical protein